MTTLEKELFAFCKQLVNHISKDGYDLLKKMYVLEQKLEENGGIPEVSIHDPIVDTVPSLEDDISNDPEGTAEVDNETGEVLSGNEKDLLEDEPEPQKQLYTSDDLDDLEDLTKDSDLPQDDLPF